MWFAIQCNVHYAYFTVTFINIIIYLSIYACMQAKNCKLADVPLLMMWIERNRGPWFCMLFIRHSFSERKIQCYWFLHNSVPISSIRSITVVIPLVILNTFFINKIKYAFLYTISYQSWTICRIKCPNWSSIHMYFSHCEWMRQLLTSVQAKPKPSRINMIHQHHHIKHKIIFSTYPTTVWVTYMCIICHNLIIITHIPALLFCREV